MSEDPYDVISDALETLAYQVEDARALALYLKGILHQLPTTLEGLDPNLAWENLPDWFTGEDQGVLWWEDPDDES